MFVRGKSKTKSGEKVKIKEQKKYAKQIFFKIKKVAIIMSEETKEKKYSGIENKIKDKAKMLYNFKLYAANSIVSNLCICMCNK